VPQLATGPVVVSRGRVKGADVVEIDRRRQGKLEAPGLGRRGSRVRDESQTAPFWFGSFCVPWDTPASPAGGRGDGNAFVLCSLDRAKPSRSCSMTSASPGGLPEIGPGVVSPTHPLTT